MGQNISSYAKYTFVSTTTTDDLVSLFVFSSGVPSIEPTPLGPVTSTTTDVADIGRFA
ncbi:MAG: hypothetical protein IPL53_18570 [Ignavibacteria bacterium]|nr:hypothetical protein [Ignavibacteria bacterium]